MRVLARNCPGLAEKAGHLINLPMTAHGNMAEYASCRHSFEQLGTTAALLQISEPMQASCLLQLQACLLCCS